MRGFYAFVVALICFCCIAPVGLPAAYQATNMQPTIYDDGKSCPGGCDAHVVFNAVHNGTRNAFDPSSSRSAPRKCRVGRQCKICFSANDASCMTALYRGGGPDVGRFDFTPAFYEENCTRTGLPEQFAAKCRSAAPIIERLKTQVNCIINPTHEKCRALMEPFVRRKAADDVLYAECKRLGLTAFNRKYRETPALQRSLDCNYEMLRTGRNSRGQTWRRLLDGACKPGTYAGRDGLDCCSGSLYAAALLDTECTQFFARR